MAYTPTPADNEVIANLPGDIRAVTTLVTNHTGAASAAHAASAISYGNGNVESALNTAAGHEADQNNPHGVTAAQIGAVALTDAVTTVTAGKIVKRDANGKIAGDITGNAATATTAATAATAAAATKLATARTIALTGGVSGSATFDGSENITIATTGGNIPNTNITVTASTQGNGSFAVGVGLGGNQRYGTYLSAISQASGTPAITSTLQNIIQDLVNRSHTHGYGTMVSNCDCACDC